MKESAGARQSQRAEASPDATPQEQPTAPVAFPREAIVTLAQLAAALQVSERIAQGMDLPYFMAGKRQRWIMGQVLDVLAQRATALTPR